jgi:hypothetical protein
VKARARVVTDGSILPSVNTSGGIREISNLPDFDIRERTKILPVAVQGIIVAVAPMPCLLVQAIPRHAVLAKGVSVPALCGPR